MKICCCSEDHHQSSAQKLGAQKTNYHSCTGQCCNTCSGCVKKAGGNRRRGRRGTTGEASPTLTLSHKHTLTYDHSKIPPSQPAIGASGLHNHKTHGQTHLLLLLLLTCLQAKDAEVLVAVVLDASSIIIIIIIITGDCPPMVVCSMSASLYCSTLQTQLTTFITFR